MITYFGASVNSCIQKTKFFPIFSENIFIFTTLTSGANPLIAAFTITALPL
jgi:hypothetical protein